MEYRTISIDTLCGLFGKSKQAYYKHKRYTMSDIDMETETLKIVHYYRSLMPIVSCTKLYDITRDIMGSTLRLGRDRFLDLMRKNDLIIKPRNPRHTTNSDHIYFKYPNRIKGLDISHVNQVWVADITYIYLQGGESCYLHLITDYYSRAIIGYVVSPTLHARYTVQALDQAITNAGGGNLCGTIHHSDRGVQYASDAYTSVLKDHNILSSMCEDYNPTDNAVAERVNGILKTEWIYVLPVMADIEEAKARIDNIIDIYNNVRPHLSLQKRTPMSVYLEDPEITPSARWYNRDEYEE